MIEKTLEENGFTENETKLYLSLLTSGPASVSTIAQNTGLHRSYLYDILEKMSKKNLVSFFTEQETKKFVATEPQILLENLKEKTKKLEDVIPKLLDLQSLDNKTTTKIFEGDHVYRIIFRLITTSVQKKGTVRLQGINEKELVESIEPLYLKQYLNQLEKNNITEKIIINKGGLKLQEYKNIKYKEIDKKYFEETGQIIFGNSVAFFINSNPRKVVLIESDKISSFCKKQFDLIWDLI